MGKARGRPQTNEPEFPNALEAAAKLRGIQQNHLAEMLGCPTTTLNNLFRGKRKLHSKWLEKLRPILKLSDGQILGTEPLPQVDDSASNATRANSPSTGIKTGEGEDELSSKSAIRILENIERALAESNRKLDELLSNSTPRPAKPSGPSRPARRPKNDPDTGSQQH